jgi:methionyl-tRNA formyltransferase
MNVAIFTNNIRGYEISKYLLSKNFKIEIIVIAKKNLLKNTLKKILSLKKNYIITKNVNDKKIIKIIKERKIDIGIIAGFPYILKKETYDCPRYSTINLHAGPLPGYRGGSPLNWQIINGEKKIGISIIKVNEKIDEGKILAQKKFFLSKRQGINEAHTLAIKNFKKIILIAINNLIKKKFIHNSKTIPKYWPQRNEEDSKVNWLNNTNVQIIDQIRASKHPYNAYFFIKKKKIKIISAKIYKSNNQVPAGTIIKNKKIIIKCKKGFLEITKKNKIFI